MAIKKHLLSNIILTFLLVIHAVFLYSQYCIAKTIDRKLTILFDYIFANKEKFNNFIVNDNHILSFTKNTHVSLGILRHVQIILILSFVAIVLFIILMKFLRNNKATQCTREKNEKREEKIK